VVIGDRAEAPGPEASARLIRSSKVRHYVANADLGGRTLRGKSSPANGLQAIDSR
jgi:hypothetical protein